jgi:hypothetical protein
VVIRIQKDPHQGFGKSVTLWGEELPVPLSAPAESVSAAFCNVKIGSIAQESLLNLIIRHALRGDLKLLKQFKRGYAPKWSLTIVHFKGVPHTQSRVSMYIGITMGLEIPGFV